MLLSPSRIHIPDGFLTPLVAVVGWALAAAVIVVALRQTRRQLDDRMVPLMGVLAAFLFAAQAITFPVAAGTSGHLIGAALAAIVVGPWAATLILASVVAVQGLVFQDGGLLAMGWNIVNMGVIAAFSGSVAYTRARRIGGEARGSIVAASFAAGWISVVLAAVATAIELAASGTSPLVLATAAMSSVHALIGIGEGLITAAAIGLLLSVRPDLLRAGGTAPGRAAATTVLVGLALAMLVAAFSPLASPGRLAGGRGESGLPGVGPDSALPDPSELRHPVYRPSCLYDDRCCDGRHRDRLRRGGRRRAPGDSSAHHRFLSGCTST
jgi:cobalt/nickel transport system permease protein